MPRSRVARLGADIARNLAVPLRAVIARREIFSPDRRRRSASSLLLADDPRLDQLRQAANLSLSVGQFAASALIFSSFNDELFSNPSIGDPLIVPADYTFGIWSLIFPASIAYGIFQALPQQRDNDLLRRVGFHTAFAFGCITLWSVSTTFDPIRPTVPLFFGALWGLATAAYRIGQHPRPLTGAERLLVLAPIGLYAAWSTVGTIANTSTSLVALGYSDLLLGRRPWAIIMLLAAGAISALTIRATRGNIAYAAGILWALAGIVVANSAEPARRPVAVAAGAMAALVALALAYARRGAERGEGRNEAER